MGNLGKTFAFGAVGTHLFFVLFMIVAWSIEMPSEENELHKKYPDRKDRMIAFGDLSDIVCARSCTVGGSNATACVNGCSDSVNMIQDRVLRMSDMVPFMVVNGLFQSLACLLAIFALLSLKTQAGFNKTMDEKEIICYVCFVLGFTIPLLQFAMRSGPVTFIVWIGSDAASEAPEFWKNLNPPDWHMLYIVLRTVESLFLWLDTLMCLLLSVAFGLSATLPSTQDIIKPLHRKVGLAISACLFLGFFFGILREISWKVGEIGVMFFYVCSGLILIPAWFGLLGVALGNTDSIEARNNLLYGQQGEEKEAENPVSTTA